MWYIAEVAASENTNVRSGVVEVSWLADASLWEYDPRVFDRLFTYLQNYWPIRTIASHICCPPKIDARFLLPVLIALVDRFTRSRIQMHDVPPSEIISSLAPYGITKEMLPKQMGGSIELFPSEWIANRRAVEMEMDEVS